jgi:hypothetical protein
VVVLEVVVAAAAKSVNYEDHLLRVFSGWDRRRSL